MKSFLLSSLGGKYSSLKKYDKGTRFQFTLFDSCIFFQFLQNFLFFMQQCQLQRSAFYFVSFIKIFNFFFFNFFKLYSNFYFISVPYPGFLSNFNALMLGSFKTMFNAPGSYLTGANYSPVIQYSSTSSLIFLDFIKEFSFISKELGFFKGLSFGFSKQNSSSFRFFYPVITDLLFKSYSIFYLLQLKDLTFTFCRFHKKRRILWKKKFLKLRRFLTIFFDWQRLFYLYSFVFFTKFSQFFLLSNYSLYAKKKNLFYFTKKRRKQKKIFQKKKTWFFSKKNQTNFSFKVYKSKVLLKIFTDKFLSNKTNFFKKKSLNKISKFFNHKMFCTLPRKKLYEDTSSVTETSFLLDQENSTQGEITTSTNKHSLTFFASEFYSFYSKMTQESVSKKKDFVSQNWTIVEYLIMFNLLVYEREKSLQLKKEIKVVGAKHQEKKNPKNSDIQQISGIIKGSF